VCMMVYTKEILRLARRVPVITPEIVSRALLIPIKSARRALLHLHKTGRIRRICKGYYTLHDDIKVIGTYLNYPSYISFLTALSMYGLTTQITARIEFASLHRWRAPKCADSLGMRYIKIPKKYFFGYTKTQEGYFIAEPEKAVIDMIIVGQNPEVHPIEWSKLNPKKLIRYAKVSKKIYDKLCQYLSTSKKLVSLI